jgi:iron complex transport system substrate-binding protein
MTRQSVHFVGLRSMKTIIFNILLVAGIFSSAPADALASPPQRIISLAPNVTEILFALGLGENIVGVTSFCDYPEAAKTKPRIGGMTNPSLEAVVSLKPDLVVLSTDGNPKEFDERLRSLGIRTYVVTARRLAELPRGIRDMSVALGVPLRGEALARDIQTALTKSGSRAGRRGTGKKVLFIVWPEPLIVAGPDTVIDDAITLLGYVNIAGAAKTAYPKYSLEEVIYQAPDIIGIGKGSGMDMHAVSKGILRRLGQVPAVRNNSICYLGDSLYRLGPRVVQGIEELATCLK